MNYFVLDTEQRSVIEWYKLCLKINIKRNNHKNKKIGDKFK